MIKNIIWILGFIFLFLLNLVVEALILPLLDLENTPRNDVYFKVWWVAVGLWFLFGRSFLKKLFKVFIKDRIIF